MSDTTSNFVFQLESMSIDVLIMKTSLRST